MTNTPAYSHPRLTEEVRSQFLSLAESDLSAAKKYLAQTLGVKKSQRNEWAKRLLEGAEVKAPIAADNFDVEVETSRAKTLEEVIQLCKVDLDQWDAKGFSVTRKKNGFGWNARFVKRPQVIGKAHLEQLKDELKNYSPTVKKIAHKIEKVDGVLLEIAIFDAHLGKMSWAVESHDDYDLKIAKRIYTEALHDLVSQALKNGPVTRIVFPVGNDYLTCDNQNLTTTALTPQSVDTRFPKIFKEGRELLVESINYLKQIAPVDVIVVAGNHDSNSMFHIGDALECWFHNDENVKIENLPTPRKYYRYGQNLICYAHGDKINHKKFPLIAAVECKDWSQCRFREIHLGHLHHERVTEENGVKTRIIPSITGSDEYHNSHGYIGSIRTSQAFSYHISEGLKAIFYSKAIE